MTETTERADALLARGADVTDKVLPVIFNIFESWRLTGAQQMALLGLSNEKTLYNWKNNPERAKLSKDLLERISYILGIYKALQVLFSNPVNADNWMRSINKAELFGERAPIDFLTEEGKVVDLAKVRDYLDNERGGW
tara:strand:- start:1692 stop:2105 length:414 start_codon:yes stop_codon:yes gene_type:complete